MFEEELKFFVSNQTDLVTKYRGKVLVIKGDKILGIYENALNAYLQAQKSNPVGSFMIQPCVPGPEAYTVTISSYYQSAPRL